MAFRTRTIGIILLCLTWLGLLVFDVFPYLRGGGEYRWPYEFPAQPQHVLPLVGILAIYLIGAYWLKKRMRVRSLILWAMLGLVALTLACLYVTADPLFKIVAVTLSGVATGWHYQAVEITDLSYALQHWTALMAAATGRLTHLSTSPPGMVLITYAFNHLMEYFPAASAALAQPLRTMFCLQPRLINYTDAQLAGAWFGLLVPIEAALTVPALYWLGRRVFDARTALWAVIWWPIVPSVLLFAPTRDTVFPLLIVVMLAIHVEGLYRNRPQWYVLSGAIMSVASFLSFSILPALFCVGVFTLVIGALYKKVTPALPQAVNWTWPLQIGLWFSLGLCSVWLIFYFVAGLTPVDLLAQGATAHLKREFNFLLWILLHLYDYLMFIGFPLVLLAAISLGPLARNWRLQRPLSIGEVLMVSLLITLVVLHLSDILRGETGRILQYFSPLVVLMAASAVSAFAPATQRSGWLITLTQAVVLVGMASVLRVVDTEFSQRPVQPARVAVPASAMIYPSGAIFGESLRLESFAGQISNTSMGGQTEAKLTLWLNWRSLGGTAQIYYQSFIPVAPDGQPMTENTLLYKPFNDTYATTCWLPENDLLTQKIEIPLQSAQIEGGWWVSFRFYEKNTGEALPVSLLNGSRDQQLGLGPFYVTP